MRTFGSNSYKYYKYKLEKLDEHEQVVESKYYCSLNEIVKEYSYLNRDTLGRYLNNKVTKEKRLHLKDYNLLKLEEPLEAIRKIKIQY